MNARFDKALDTIKKKEERCPGEWRKVVHGF